MHFGGDYPWLMDRRTVPLPIRLARHTERTPGCWLWRGTIQTTGYGQIRVGQRGPVYLAHRLAWELANGPIPKGMLVLHHCDNPPCVRPDHLFLGTHRDNALDCIAKGRRPKHHRPHTRMRKLSDDQVRAIRADPRPIWQVAHDHGVSETAAYNVRTRRRKALVPD